MLDTLFLLSLLVIAGTLAGAWLQRQAPARRRQAGLLLLALTLLPVVALLLAGGLGSSTLGWVAGLGLMALLTVGLPLVAAATVGFVVSASLRGRTAGAAPAQPPAPAARAASLAATGTVRRSRANAVLPSPRMALLQVIAAVGAAMVVALGAGFRLAGGGTPTPILWLFWPALAVLVGLGWSLARARCRRVAARRADPVVQTATAVVPAPPPRAAGDACCLHLQPLAQELTRAGLAVRPLGGRDVQVQAVLELASLPPLPDGVQPEEPVRPDERGTPEQLARLYCAHCGTSLWFVHPQRARADTPRHRPQTT